VFLTEHHAWKLKKPVSYSFLDFGSEHARRVHCAEEIRLNRRLAPHVYLGIVPLMVTADGRLTLEPGGTVVDWLVKMRRLPSARMLDRLIHQHAVHAADLRHVVGTLARFYHEARRIPLTPSEYRSGFVESIAANRCELALPEFGLPLDLVEPTCTLQRAFVDDESALFDRRVAAGRIVEGHGDLRPEHVCVEREPQVIDCLEFAPELRVLDAADELAYLGLECERLGAPALSSIIFDAWHEATGDAPPAELVHFYQSHRACVRARIALWHLREPLLHDQPRWQAQARSYLALARAHIERCP
jgi:aminoglycoside phosphotransferase family enzyme